MDKKNIRDLLKDIIEKAERLLIDDDIIKSDTVNNDVLVRAKMELDKLKEQISENRKLLIRLDDSNIKYGVRLSDYIGDIYGYVENLNSAIDSKDISHFNKIFNHIFRNFEKIIEGAEQLPLIEKFISDKQKVILVGANGSGKSALANHIKESLFTNIKVIPATKYLYMQSNPQSATLKSSPKELSQMQADNIIKPSKGNIHNLESINSFFTKSIVTLCNEHTRYCADKENGNTELRNNVFNDLKLIWNNLIPDIKLETDTNERSIIGIKNSSKFSINDMSDGERAILYFASNILMAEEKSIIVIDEPETSLNDNVSLKLWKMLCEQREDCQFVFISHNLNFITNIGDSDIVWCKSYSPPDKWDLKEVEQGDLPLELIVKIASSKKPILYCEGQIDQQVFEELFGDSHTIIKANGHQNVINYVRLHSKHSSLKVRSCMGIIDRDNNDDDKIIALEKDNIYVLHHNEIEMFLLNEDILNHTMYEIFKGESLEKISKFKKQFFETLSESRVILINRKIKSEIDSYFENERIESDRNINKLKSSIINLINKPFNYEGTDILTDEYLENYINDLHQKCSQEISKIIEEKNYDKALQICNLKEKVSKGLANFYLDSKYLDKAIIHLNNPEIREALIKKYFPKIKPV